MWSHYHTKFKDHCIMAYYDYKCSECDCEVELSKKISERDDTLDIKCSKCESVGTLERQVSSSLIAYSVVTPGGYGKIPDGFKEVLKRIDSRAPDSQMKKTSSFL